MNQLDVGAVFSRVFQIYGSQFPTLFGTALLVNLVTALLAVFVAGSVGVLLLFVVSIVLTTLYSGMVVKLVQDLEDGRRDSSIGQLIASVTPVVGPLIGVAIVAGLAVGVGLLLLLVPGLFLLTIWAVVAPVIVVERKGFDALGRSQELVKGNGWPVFGTILLSVLLGFVASLLASAVASAIGGDAGLFLGNWILPALAAPVGALISGVLYFSLRGWGSPETPTGLPLS